PHSCRPKTSPTYPSSLVLFLFPPPPTTALYTLSLHDALPISADGCLLRGDGAARGDARRGAPQLGRRARRGDECRRDALLRGGLDRKSTRLNSSHGSISYAVFCLKKKKHT